MKNIIGFTVIPLFTFLSVFVSRGQAPVAIPEMRNELDSVSYYVGMACGTDVASDLEAIDKNLFAVGFITGYVSGESSNDEASEFLSEFLAPYVYSDETAAGRELLKTLPDTDERYIRRYSGQLVEGQPEPRSPVDYYTPDGFTSSDLGVWRAGSELAVRMPELENRIDSAMYYRGVKEGMFVARWLDEIEPVYVLDGIMAGFMLESEHPVFDEISPYLTNYFYEKEFGEGYGGSESYYGRDWSSQGFDFPEGMQLPELATEMDTVGFIAGLSIGKSILEEADVLPVEKIIAGLKVGLEGNDDIPSEKIYAYLSYMFEERFPEIKTQMALEELKPVLDSLAALPGISRTESGLLYQILAPGDMSVMLEDIDGRVELKYTITTLDGEPHDSSGGEVEECSLPDMMSGIGEALTMIGKGGRIRLYIPPGLTDDGDGYKRNYGARIFEADLVLVEPRLAEVKAARERAAMEEFLAEYSSRPGIRRTESGLLYEIISQGDMSLRITNKTGYALLKYDIEYNDGDHFNSSGDEAEECSLGDMMEGFVEGAMLVGKGGRIKVYIPPTLTNDADGYERDYGNYVFIADITVVDPEP